MASLERSVVTRFHSRPKGLATNYGEEGATKREGGRQVKFYPYEKGGRSKLWGSSLCLKF